MKPLIALIPLLLGPLFLGTPSFAAENEPTNIFNANLTNPDLALAVSKFEEICMPFVLHETELTWEQDKRHQAKLMESRGFVFRSEENRSERFIAGPNPDYVPAPEVPKNQFTIFDGVSNQFVEPTETLLVFISPPRGNYPNIYKVATRRVETYQYNQDKRLTTELSWNSPFSVPPGKSCEIKLTAPEITPANFTANFIDKDSDWMPVKSGWSQCVRNGEDEFEFTVYQNTDSLSLNVKRNDFFEPKLCQKAQR